MTPDRPDDATPPPDRTRIFHLLVANTLAASVTNNFLWFALTFWVYLETLSVLATAIIGGGYMLLVAISGMAFGTFVDRHLRRTSMLLSSAISLATFTLAAVLFSLSPESSFRDLTSPAFWALVVLVLTGAIAGNLRAVALSTTVTLLVPEDGRDRANGLVGTANGVAFAITSVFSGLAIGLLGMGWALVIAVGDDGARDRPSPDDPDPGSAAAAERGRATLHRLPRSVAGDPASSPACWRSCCSRPSTTSWAACSCR